MAVNIGQIKDPLIHVIPSKKLRDFLSNIKISDDIPVNIKRFVFKNKTKESLAETASLKNIKLDYLINEDDAKFIKSLNLKKSIIKREEPQENNVLQIDPKEDRLLSLSDLHWIHHYIQIENKNKEEKIYLHVLLENSEVVLPKNVEIPRNEELENRCKRLRIQQQNREYHKMTKNVDNLRKRLPEDTIAYQFKDNPFTRFNYVLYKLQEFDNLVPLMSKGFCKGVGVVKQLNRQLIAIFQFIVTVLAGFAFGFIGVELIVGGLDFGFRLLLGIICALVIALAELYFLAKRLNEDLQFEYTAASVEKNRQKNIKQD